MPFNVINGMGFRIPILRPSGVQHRAGPHRPLAAGRRPAGRPHPATLTGLRPVRLPSHDALIDCGIAAAKREIEDIKLEILARQGLASVVAHMT
jgi:hypothetical protein